MLNEVPEIQVQNEEEEYGQQQRIGACDGRGSVSDRFECMGLKHLVREKEVDAEFYFQVLECAS